MRKESQSIFLRYENFHIELTVQDPVQDDRVNICRKNEEEKPYSFATARANDKKK